MIIDPAKKERPFEFGKKNQKKPSARRNTSIP